MGGLEQGAGVVTKQWKSRIVDHGEEDPAQLLANPHNWRIHPKAQQQALESVLDDVGWVQDVIVNQRTGHVVDGHLRVSLAISREEPTIPVVYVDLNEAEERLVLASLDPLAGMAVTDNEKLAEVISEINIPSEDLEIVLKSLAGSGIDPTTEWQGMPEFVQPDKSSYHSIVVHFKSEMDIEKFINIVNQPISLKTKFIWFPARNADVDDVGMKNDLEYS